MDKIQVQETCSILVLTRAPLWPVLNLMHIHHAASSTLCTFITKRPPTLFKHLTQSEKNRFLKKTCCLNLPLAWKGNRAV